MCVCHVETIKLTYTTYKESPQEKWQKGHDHRRSEQPNLMGSDFCGRTPPLKKKNNPNAAGSAAHLFLHGLGLLGA